MATQDILLSQKFNNYNYAPGIATYGIDGKMGQAGIDGNNIYFTDCNLLTDTDEDLKILAELIANNYLPVKGSTTQINRSYKNNDLFFDYNGIIYQLTNIDDLIGNKNVGGIYSDYFNIAGKINIADISNVFAWVGDRMILNSSTYGGYDIVTINNPKNASNYINKDAVVNIISDNVNENSNIEMIKLQSIDDVDIEDGNLSVYYKTTENAFYLDSNKPIVINGDVKLNNDNNTNNEYDNFSTILTSNDTVTYFKHVCDKLRYNVLYDSEVNRYKLVIYQEDGGRDDLEYLINRNETVYGKVYSNENDQILLKLENYITDKIDSSKYYEKENIANFDFENIEINKKGFKFNAGADISINSDYLSCSSTMLDNNLLTLDIFFKNAPTDYNSLNQLFTEHIFAAGIISNKQNTSIYSLTRQNTYVINSSINVSTYDKNVYANDGIYKYTFNNNDINFVIFPLLINPYSIIDENPTSDETPTSYYIEQYPISININNITNENISGEKTIYFEIKHSENVFSIKNILVSTKNNLLDRSNVEHPCIVSYLPDSVESVQRFSLLHNTEIFINYQE